MVNNLWKKKFLLIEFKRIRKRVSAFKTFRSSCWRANMAHFTSKENSFAKNDVAASLQIKELNDTKLYDDLSLPEDMEFLTEKNLKSHVDETCDDDVSMMSDNFNKFEIDNNKGDEENDDDNSFSFHDETSNDNFLVTK
jgi:hypothetical protein